MRKRPKKIEYAATVEVDRRSREVRLLLNLMEPDPEYQPFFLSDEASALDAVGTQPEVIQARLEFYLKRPLPVPLATPLWQLVDAVKELCPGWPDDWSPNVQ